MKTCVHLWKYLAEFFLEWEMFQTKVVEEIKTHILFSVNFSRKLCLLWDNVGKSMVQPDRHVNIWCWVEKFRFACRITKARIQAQTRNILCLLLHNWMIPFDFVKCFMVNLQKEKKAEKLCNESSAIMICLAKLCVRPWANERNSVWMQHRTFYMKTNVGFLIEIYVNLYSKLEVRFVATFKYEAQTALFKDPVRTAL
jgi:hypothetical protein